MFFAIRLMTLLAFTTHAVLGCCLSHGSCLREHTAALTGQCCDHGNHSCASHNDVESHAHGDLEVASTLLCNAGCTEFLSADHGHSNGCDHATCAFGVSRMTSNPLNLQFAANSTGAHSVICSWLCSCRATGHFCNALDSPPRALHNRAVFQVWLI